jgi:DNA-directed RNA polymerase subunit RPC12/RpoP
MEIIAKCTGCYSVWKLDGDAADRRVRCRKCGRLFKVPKPDEVPKAAKVIEQTKGSVYVDEDGKTYG